MSLNVDSLHVRARRLARRARAVLRDVRDPRAVLETRRLIAALRSECPGLFESSPPRDSDGSRHVLVVSLSDDAQQIQLEALLAKALELHGGEVTILTFRSARRAVRLFRAHGLRQVHYEDFVSTGSTVNEEAPAALERCRTIQDFKAFEYQQARIGRQALSTVIRARHEPRLDLDDESIRADIRRTIEYAIEGVEVGDRVLDAGSPDCLLMIERGYAGFGSIFDRALARDIPVIQFQAAHRDDSFFLKRYTLEARDLHSRSLDERTWLLLLRDGWNPCREVALTRELAAQEEGKWFLARRHRHAAWRRGPEELREHLSLDPDRKVAVLFSHILWDASMFYGRDIYPDQGRWFIETVRLAAEDDRVQWLVKLHPALFWKLRTDGNHAEPAELEMIREAIGVLPPHVRLLRPDDDVDNTDLFRIIDAGVTIRGTVGLELPSLGVPVLTAGTSDYSGRGFTVDADTVEEYERNVRSIVDLERLEHRQVELAKLYAYGIFCLRPWQFSSFTLEYLPLDQAAETMEHRLRYHVRTLDDLGRVADLARFADWVLRSDEPDYLDEQELASSRQVAVR